MYTCCCWYLKVRFKFHLICTLCHRKIFRETIWLEIKQIIARVKITDSLESITHLRSCVCCGLENAKNCELPEFRYRVPLTVEIISLGDSSRKITRLSKWPCSATTCQWKLLVWSVQIREWSKLLGTNWREHQIVVGRLTYRLAWLCRWCESAEYAIHQRVQWLIGANR